MTARKEHGPGHLVRGECLASRMSCSNIEAARSRSAVIATLVAPRGLRELAAGRFGQPLLPVGYRVRPPRG